MAPGAAAASPLYTTRIAAASRGHGGACGMEEKITVMRGMMVVPRAGCDGGERGQQRCCGERERERSSTVTC